MDDNKFIDQIRSTHKRTGRFIVDEEKAKLMNSGVLPPKLSEEKSKVWDERVEEKFIVTTGKGEYTFFGDFSFDKDTRDCLGTGTLRTLYREDNWQFWEPGFTELMIFAGTHDFGKIFQGRTREIKQDGEYITITLQDVGWKLKQRCEVEYSEEEVAEVFKKLVKEAGMVPVIMGLTKNYTTVNQYGGYSDVGTENQEQKTLMGDTTPTPVTDAPIDTEVDSYKQSVTKTSLITERNYFSLVTQAIANAQGAVQNHMGGDVIVGAGKPSCRYSCGTWGRDIWYTSAVPNYCPECQARGQPGTGTIAWVQGVDYHWCSRQDNPGVEGMYVCCQRLGGCDSDWCICGKNHTARFRDLTLVSPMVRTNAPITLAIGTGGVQNVHSAAMSQIQVPTASTSSSSTSSAQNVIKRAVKTVAPIARFVINPSSSILSRLMVFSSVLLITAAQRAIIASVSRGISTASTVTSYSSPTIDFSQIRSNLQRSQEIVAGVRASLPATNTSIGGDAGYSNYTEGMGAVDGDVDGVDQGANSSTYEEEINHICKEADEQNLIWFTTQNNECVLVDFQYLMREIMDMAFELEGWMVEYPSFSLDVNQFGFANAVEVKYRNGTLVEAYDDLVLVFGEKKMSHVKESMDRSQAKKFARAELARHLRDFSLDISATVLHSYKIVPGSFVTLENPQTGSKEVYYVSGINVNNSPTSALTCSLNLKYAPENPLVTAIPEIAGAMGGGLFGGPIESIVDQVMRSAAHITHRLRTTTDPDVMMRNGVGDCWAMSAYLCRELIRNGVQARVINYRTNGSNNHRTVQYLNSGGVWTDVPYTGPGYEFSGGFRTTRSRPGMRVLSGCGP